MNMATNINGFSRLNLRETIETVKIPIPVAVRAKTKAKKEEAGKVVAPTEILAVVI